MSRIMLIAGAVIVLMVAGLSVYNLRAFVEHRVGGARYQAIVNGHDLIADYIPPPLLPYEAFTLIHETADTPNVNLDKQIANWKQLRQAFDDRMAHWEAEMAERPFLPPQEWQLFRDGIAEHGKTFWGHLENDVIPAFRSGNTSQVDAAISAVTSDFRKFIDFANENDDFIAETVASGEQDSLGASNLSLGLGIAVAFLAILFLLVIIYAGQKFVVRALTSISRTMAELSNGNLQVAVPFEKRKDEVGEMARAVMVFKRHAQENHASKSENEQVINALGAGLERLSHGDLTRAISEPFPGSLDALRVRFNETVDTLRSIISNVRTSTESLEAGTSEIAGAADDLSRRTESQAANLEQTAAAVAEITSKVNQSAAGVSHARSIVAHTKDEANISGQVMHRAVSAIGEIQDSSQKIMQIIGVMDEIAFQTNLLALNAGVEAARAGDAGRGFAVVASEVRSLSQRSAEAAKDIKNLLSLSQSAVEQGVELVGQTGTSLNSIIKRIEEINDIVARVAESAEQQASGLREVNTAVEQMDQMTQQNAAMVEETTAATRSLTEKSEALAKLVAHFTVAAHRASEVPGRWTRAAA